MCRTTFDMDTEVEAIYIMKQRVCICMTFNFLMKTISRGRPLHYMYPNRNMHACMHALQKELRYFNHSHFGHRSMQDGDSCNIIMTSSL